MTANNLFDQTLVLGEPSADDEARAAVRVGLWASAARCVLTYVVAPTLGGLGIVLGPAGLLLQVLGAITSSAGAYRLWRLGHRARYPYAAVALAVWSATALAVLSLL